MPNLAPRVKFRLKAHKLQGLKNAPQILRKNLRGGLTGIGSRLTLSSQKFMRVDRGRQRRSLRTSITGPGIDLELQVYSRMVQAFVDAYGIKARTVFPPFVHGTRLYDWTRRKLAGSGPDKIRPRSGAKKQRKPRKVRKIRKAGQRGTGPVYRPAIVAKARRTKNRNWRIEKISYIVARKIFLHGIRANQWNIKALDANMGQIINDLRNAMRRAALEMSKG